MHHQHLHLLTPFIILSISAFFDSYAFIGLKTLVNTIPSPRKRLFIYRIYWICCIAMLINLLVALFLVRSIGDRHMFFFNMSFSAYICFSSMKFMFVLCLLGNDFYRLISRCFHPYFFKRNRKVTRVGIYMAALSLVICIFGTTHGKYYYKVHRQAIYFEDLPPAFDGFAIVQLSDIHAGSYKRAKSVQRGIDIVNAQHADLFVFTGDIVNSRSAELAPWIDYFEQIKVPYGQYAILGNHDYGGYARWKNDKEKEDNLELLKDYFQRMDYRLLLNEHVEIEKDGQSIILLGVENWGKNFGEKGDLAEALQGVDKNSFKILLTHNPSHWEEKVKNDTANIQLSLSGHTHGMQMGIEIPGFIEWSPAKYLNEKWAGLYEENGRYLYINRGFGFVGFPGRIGMRPEITVIVLRKK